MEIKDKQIEEMAKDIACLTAWDEDEIPTINCLETAKRLYLKGYRKSQDVAEEIFAEIDKQIAFFRMYMFLNQGVKAIVKTLDELKKKYTEEGK